MTAQTGKPMKTGYLTMEAYLEICERIVRSVIFKPFGLKWYTIILTVGQQCEAPG